MYTPVPCTTKLTLLTEPEKDLKMSKTTLAIFLMVGVCFFLCVLCNDAKSLPDEHNTELTPRQCRQFCVREFVRCARLNISRHGMRLCSKTKYDCRVKCGK